MWLALFAYGLKLINGPSKKGIFEASLKTFTATGILASTGALFMVATDIVGYGSLNYFYTVLEILVSSILLFGLYQLYKAWTNPGQSYNFDLTRFLFRIRKITRK